jgi:nucleoside-diphosphate-sugar epimerase
VSADQLSKRYVVTGCAGFIGANVTRLLLAAGHQVLGLDNVNDTYDPRLKTWRLAALKRETSFEFHALDIADRSLVREFFARASGTMNPFAAVFHLASRAGVRPSVEDPWVYVDTNVTGSLNLLEACRAHKIPKYVLASTSSIYGAECAGPFREDAEGSRPLSPYAASKKAAEVMAYSYHVLHGLDVSVLRYFTVYGPAGRPDMSVFRFIRQIAREEPLLVFGDGSQQRDFTYVDDIARGTVAAGRPLGYEIINLGGDRPVPLSQVIRLISEQIGREPRIEYRPAHAADVPGTWADISKAGRLLGWRPETSLEDGLAVSIQWYEQNQELANQLRL